MKRKGACFLPKSVTSEVGNLKHFEGSRLHDACSFSPLLLGPTGLWWYLENQVPRKLFLGCGRSGGESFLKEGLAWMSWDFCFVFRASFGVFFENFFSFPFPLTYV